MLDLQFIFVLIVLGAILGRYVTPRTFCVSVDF